MRVREDIGAIAFDLDGTLVDSAPDIAAALDAALVHEGLQRFELNTVRSWIGDGPDALIVRGAGRARPAASERGTARPASLRFRCTHAGRPARLRRGVRRHH